MMQTSGTKPETLPMSPELAELLQAIQGMRDNDEVFGIGSRETVHVVLDGVCDVIESIARAQSRTVNTIPESLLKALIRHCCKNPAWIQTAWYEHLAANNLKPESLLDTGSVPEGFILMPTEPTPAIVKAMAESKARDDEGEFPAMLDLLDFGGENKTNTVLAAAYKAAITAEHSKQG